MKTYEEIKALAEKAADKTIPPESDRIFRLTFITAFTQGYAKRQVDELFERIESDSGISDQINKLIH